MPKALVVGGLGVVGRANVEYLTTLSDWSVVALSRRKPDFETRAQFISCDVTDRVAVRAALANHSDITHVVFAALHEQPAGLVAGWSESDTVRTNVAMLANTLDALGGRCPGTAALRADARRQGLRRASRAATKHTLARDRRTHHAAEFLLRP